MVGSSNKNSRFWTVLSGIGVLGIFLSAILMVAGNLIQPTQMVPAGEIDHVDGKVTACRNENGIHGKSHYTTVVDYSYLVNDKPYTATVYFSYSCSDYAPGKVLAIYYLKENPAASSFGPTSTALYTAELSPFAAPALGCLGVSILLVIIGVAASRPNRRLDPP